MRREAALACATGALVAAATLPLRLVFADLSWIPVTWLAAGVALVVAVGARRLGLGAMAAAGGSLVSYVVYVYVVHLEVDALLPGMAQLAEYQRMWALGFTDLATQPAPAPLRDGLALVLATGVWAVVYATHEVLVRARRPGLALLPAATLWAVPLVVPHPAGRTWPEALPFLAAAALVLLLEANGDLPGWQRSAALRPPPAAGLAVGGVALALAGFMPGLIPGYGAAPWVDLSAQPGVRGYQPIVDISRRLHLPEPQEVLRYRSSRPLYLRIAGLDTFDGSSWRLGPAHAATFSPDDVVPAHRLLAPEVEMQERTSISVAIHNVALDNIFVPVPYQPAIVEGQAARRMVYSRDGAFIATSQVTEGPPALVPGIDYEVTSNLPTPSAAQLREVGFDAYDGPEYARWIELPHEYPSLREETDRVVAEAGATSPFEVAFALQAHFRNPELFRYSVEVPPLRGIGALESFVLEERLGYCEQYAAAMAVMLRQAGVPARVAVGFRVGQLVQPGEYVVTTHHAHAWVEVLFPGYGWINFEPTPSLPDTLVPTQTDVSPLLPWAARDPGEGGPGNEIDPDLDLDDFLDPFPLPGEELAPPSDGRERTPLTVPAGLAATVLLLAAGALLLSRRTAGVPLDERGRIVASQRRVLVAARRYGLGRRPAETAREVAARWTHEGRVDPARAARLVDLAQAAAFGGRVEDGSSDEAESLGAELRASLRASVPRSARVLAPVRLPTETAVTAARRSRAWLKDHRSSR